MLARSIALVAAMAVLSACSTTATTSPPSTPAPSTAARVDVLPEETKSPDPRREPKTDRAVDKDQKHANKHGAHHDKAHKDRAVQDEPAKRPRRSEPVRPRAGQSGDLTLKLRHAVEVLLVEEETRTGYDRDLFKHWIDADGNCRDTRDDVLAAEALSPVDGCEVRVGRWRSAYDGERFTDSSDLDIDHMVPLAEAWDSGALRWSPDTRERFANDLDDPRALIAVSASSNRSKSDSDPAEWLPDLSHCRYLHHWVAVKLRWSLHVDTAEQDSLRRLAGTCRNRTITVTLAEMRHGPAPAPEPSPPPMPPPASEPDPPPGRDCEAGYDPCVPPFPPDLNCDDLDGPIRVTGDDPHGLDADGDGIGCSS